MVVFRWLPYLQGIRQLAFGSAESPMMRYHLGGLLFITRTPLLSAPTTRLHNRWCKVTICAIGAGLLSPFKAHPTISVGSLA
jgi:hypothetical protein